LARISLYLLHGKREGEEGEKKEGGKKGGKKKGVGPSDKIVAKRLSTNVPLHAF